MREPNSSAAATDGPTVTRTMRILRHRTLRWFQPPVREVVRDRAAAAAVQDRRHRDG